MSDPVVLATHGTVNGAVGCMPKGVKETVFMWTLSLWVLLFVTPTSTELQTANVMFILYVQHADFMLAPSIEVHVLPQQKELIISTSACAWT